MEGVGGDRSGGSPARWRLWGLIFGAWTVVSLLVATQVYLRPFPSATPPSWHGLVLLFIIYWYGWGLMTPVIFALGRAFPIERECWRRNVVVHFLLSAAVALAFIAYYAFLKLQFAIEGEPIYGLSFGSIFIEYLGLFFFYDMLTYWTVLGIGLAINYYAMFHERSLVASRLQTRLAQAQIRALRTQIQPHFLFNTLHAVSALMDEDVAGARRMIARLSELLRLSLDKGHRQTISLREELELLDHYLAIEEVRFQDRLTVHRDIAPGTLDAEVPSLILQPLVENAIRHGVGSLTSGGRIEICCAFRDGQLEMEVRDNGRGIPDERLRNLEEGIGLSNARARLAQLYGATARIDLRNVEGGGLRVTLTLPLSRRPDGRPED